MELWLKWAENEFNLEGLCNNQLVMDGKRLFQLSEVEFLARTPMYAGDILWQHLDILRKGNYT